MSHSNLTAQTVRDNSRCVAECWQPPSAVQLETRCPGRGVMLKPLPLNVNARFGLGICTSLDKVHCRTPGEPAGSPVSIGHKVARKGYRERTCDFCARHSTSRRTGAFARAPYTSIMRSVEVRRLSSHCSMRPHHVGEVGRRIHTHQHGVSWRTNERQLNPRTSALWHDAVDTQLPAIFGGSDVSAVQQLVPGGRGVACHGGRLRQW